MKIERYCSYVIMSGTSMLAKKYYFWRDYSVTIIFLCLFCATIVRAQSPSTQGTDFYVAFPYNYESITELKLIITGQRSCSGRVENPRTGWSASFSVSPSQVTNVVIPIAQAYNDDIGVFNHGIHVATTDTVSVYASSYYEASFDVANVLPTSSLRDSYIIQTYPNAEYSWSLFTVVATENNTIVDITPSAIPGDRYNLSRYSVTLQAGQVYHTGCYGAGSMSGTVITSRDCKPIAVFAGSSVAFVPSDVCCGDFLFEQLMPTDYHGRHFVVTSSEMRNEDRVIITASEDNCEVRSGNQLVTTLSAGESVEFYITDYIRASYLETSKPAQVYLYFTGGSMNSDQIGDPSMVLISPIEQRINKITFGTFTTSLIENHFVNVVTPTEAVSAMMLDGVNVSRYFSVVGSNSSYSYARIPISYGSHTLENAVGGFVAHVYGLGQYESYSYTVGSNAVNLSSSLNVAGARFFSSGVDGFCVGQEADFSLLSDLNISSAQWSFGDGTSAEGLQASHAYAHAGAKNIKVLFASSQGRCANRVDSLYATVLVRGAAEGNTTQRICDGSSYVWNDAVYDSAGTFTDTLLSADGCDSIDHLNLSLYPAASTHVSEECADNALPHRFGGHNFYRETDTVLRFSTARGCDSLVYYSLRVWHGVETRFDTTVCSDALPMVWRGVTFSGAGSKTLNKTSVHGADSTVRLTLNVNATSSSRYRDTVVENALPHLFAGLSFDHAVADTLLHLTNIRGCDSAIRYSLVVYRNVATTVDTAVCENVLPLSWNGRTFRTEGTQQATFAGYRGVDSVVTMRLAVLHNSNAVVHDTIVENNLPFTFAGVRFADAQTDTVLRRANRAGCDSLITFSLFVWHNRATTVDSAVCSSNFPFLWYGSTVRGEATLTASLRTLHGADSVVTLNVTSIPVTSSSYYDTIVQNQLPYRFAGISFSDAQSDTTLRRTNAAGCDSLIRFSLYVYRNVETRLDSAVCEGILPLRWNGKTFRSEGTQSAVLSGAHGVDSMVVMTLRVRHNSSSIVLDTVLENDLPHLFEGLLFTTDVDDTLIRFVNAVGCDSLLHYSLSVLRNVAIVVDSIVCENELPLAWNGIELTQSDTQQVSLIARNGTDSIVTLRLTVLSNSSYEEHDTVVENMLPFHFADTSFTSIQSDTLFVLRNAAGCDSLIHFSLFVHWNYSQRYDTAVCDNALPLLWRSLHFSQGELRKLSLRASTGADSTLVFTLRVNSTYDDSLPMAICSSSSFTVGDTVLTTQGNYDILLSSVAGCDSMIHLDLSVYDVYSSTEYDTVCSNHPRFFEGSTYDQSGTYSRTYLTSSGCDSVRRLHLFVKPAYDDTDNYVICYGDTLRWSDGMMYYRSTEEPILRYMAVNGCDSVHRLSLVVDEPVRAAIHASPQIVDEVHQPVLLSDVTFNSVSRQWYFNGLKADTAEVSSFAFPVDADSVVVSLAAYSGFGCGDTASVVIRSDVVRLWVPNVFTPSRIDNNLFSVVATQLSSFEIHIYTRQGLMVYASTNQYDTWDGTHLGAPCPQGVYAYTITYASVHQPRQHRTLSGTITLLR